MSIAGNQTHVNVESDIEVGAVEVKNRTTDDRLVVNADGSINTTLVAGGVVTANQGTPNTTANRWPVQLTDGTDLALVTAAGALNVDGSGVTQPISAAALPLPTGAATEATLLGVKTGTDRIPAQGAALTVASTPVNIASDQTVPVSAVALPLPAGAATSAKQDTGNASLASIDGKLNSLGQKAMAASAPVVIASDQTAIPISGSITANLAGDDADLDTGVGADNHDVVAIGLPASGGHVVGGTATDPLRIDPTGTTTQPISAAALPLPTGAATAALQTQPGVDIGDVTINNGAGASAVNIQDGGNSLTIDATALPLPTGAATAALQTQPGVDIGDVTVNNAAGASAVNVQDGGNSLTIDGTVTANSEETRPAAASVTQVASSASSTTLKASNANRRALTIYNDSTQILYVKCGATASPISYTVQVGSQAYFELPQPCYTGVVDGIWAAANGNAYVTEITNT